MSEEKIHVLYILTKLELGGAQKVSLTLLKGVRNEVVKSSLVSGTEGVLVPEAQKCGSVHLIKSFKREVGIKTIFYEFVTFFKMISLMRRLKRQNPNIIVHTHSTKAGLVGRWAAVFARIKKRVHTVHGFGFHDHQSKIGWGIHFILEYLTSLITTHYVCVSHNDRSIGKRLLPRFEEKSSVIRAAVDWHTFQPATRSSNKQFVFGTVSCLKPQKNILDLLKAFKYMHDKLCEENKERAHLQIIGNGVQRPLIECWLDKNNMSHKVDLLGWQSDVSKWMRSWSVFTMSSLWEGLPCAIVEARLSKLPVISYKIAGIPEVIIDQENGFLVKAGEWQTLGKRMKAIIENQDLYDKMRNYNENLNDFRNSAMVDEHVKLYKQLFWS